MQIFSISRSVMARSSHPNLLIFNSSSIPQFNPNYFRSTFDFERYKLKKYYDQCEFIFRRGRKIFSSVNIFDFSLDGVARSSPNLFILNSSSIPQFNLNYFLSAFDFERYKLKKHYYQREFIFKRKKIYFRT